MLIDIHAHCNFSAFKNDANDVIQRALDQNMQMILVGSQYSTSERAAKMAASFDNGVYAAIGLHPMHLMEQQVNEQGHKFKTKAEKFDPAKYQALIDNNKKIVAIGEVGLDYYWHDKDEVEVVQKQALEQQFEFAYENKLPIIIHCRKAHEDLLPFLAELTKDKPPGEYGVIHSYYGSYNRAMAYIKAGFLISFTGIITYSSSCDKLIARLPQDKVMIETDCPYLAPEPKRNERNEPAFLQYSAQKVANIWDVRVEQVAQVTSDNARRLFKI